MIDITNRDNGELIYRSCFATTFKEAIEDGVALGISLRRASLWGKDLTGLNVTGGDFAGSTFAETILDNAIFNKCCMDDCKFEDSFLRNTTFGPGTTIKNFNVRGAMFHNTRLCEPFTDLWRLSCPQSRNAVFGPAPELPDSPAADHQEHPPTDQSHFLPDQQKLPTTGKAGNPDAQAPVTAGKKSRFGKFLLPGLGATAATACLLCLFPQQNNQPALAPEPPVRVATHHCLPAPTKHATPEHQALASPRQQSHQSSSKR